MRQPSIRVVTLIAGGVALFACSAQRLFDSSGSHDSPTLAGAVCTEGREGCACTGDGQTSPCGQVVSRAGDYTSCSSGTAVCNHGVWGACTAKTRVIRSLNATTLSAHGAKPLSVSLTCPEAGVPDPCDPDCTVTTSNASDVDANQFSSVGDGDLQLAANGCVGTQCQQSRTCAPGSPTTLTGVVYDPAGNQPVFNALVYVPVDPTVLPPFTPGPTCNACAAEEAVSAVAITKTAADGTFTLTNVPSTDVGSGQAIPLVVQVGHWRRVQMLPSVPQCQATAVAKENSRLPTSLTDGAQNHADLPKIALVTGADDPVECLLLKMGVDPVEFEPGDGTHAVDVYRNNGNSLAAPTPAGATLYGAPTPVLNDYDIVLLPCPGTGNNDSVANANTMADYANAGGHVFATHWSYSWLAMTSTTVAQATNPITLLPNPFYGVAQWQLGTHSYAQPVVADVDTSVPEGSAFAAWLGTVGAYSPPGQLTLNLARHDVGVVNAPAQRWIYDDVAPGEPFYFSFDTPFPQAADAGTADAAADGGAAPGTCGRVAFSDFHVSASDVVQGNGTCGTNADCGFSATCMPGTPGACTPVACGTDASCKENETCQGATPGTCTATGMCTVDGECQSGQCMPDGTCAPPTAPCVLQTDCGTAETCSGSTPGACMGTCVIDSDCGGGQLCNKGQCTGCWSATNCPSQVCNGATSATCSAAASTIPLSCLQTPMSGQEKALEFMLFDLTTCETPAPAPSAPMLFVPATFSEVIAPMVSASPTPSDPTPSAVCPLGTAPIWRRLEWNASVPDSASITFSAQTADPPDDGGPTDWDDAPTVELETVTSAIPEPGAVFLDTGDGGALLANPSDAGDASTVPGTQFRLTVTLNPTSDGLGTPTLLEWRVFYDCTASE
jgi:hypothetical protein